ncbi:MAG: RagB/SusD family nutrient uptake outer membrane protein [Massilibacteroides sp.]|nr:RagB/SusD family nutrient uptake outer membrane protein [Massilibacteroides sp.]
MNNKIYIVVGLVLLGMTACNNLDLVPLAEGSSESWYSSETELEMSLNDLYKKSFWPTDDDRWADDFTYRETTDPFTNATVNGQNGNVTSLWQNQYKCIARANGVILNAEKAASNGVSQEKIEGFLAEAYFHRAAAYAKLVTKFGDVPLVTEVLDIETAFEYGRTDKQEVIAFVYKEFDQAAASLPSSYGGGSQRATKGAALALKARFALFMGDYQVAAEAAKAVMDMKTYKLHDDYSDLFLTKNADESILVIPQSIANNVYIGTKEYVTRNAGGWVYMTPSWDLLAAYTCTDGKPIDESPLFDSHNPFKNRDPRCSATIVPFGSRFLGFEFNPHPEALEVMNYNTGKMVKNNDTRANAKYATFNGLLWKKGIDDSWTQNGYKAEPDIIIIRYAEVLLTYAEAKIELGEIDASVLNAMNQVRARAYKVDVADVADYPAFTSTDQSTLRQQLRVERRMEFAHEGQRYEDIIRWKQAEVSLSRKNYGMLYPSSLLIEKVTSQGDWFWASTPEIDENGLPDFSKLEQAGKIGVLSERYWDDKLYEWPIPTSEILINENMKQNSGY